METTSNDIMNGSGERVKNAANDVVGSIKSAGREVFDATKKAACDVSEQGKDAFKKYAEEGKKQLATVETVVRDNPVRSVLISAAAGFLLSRFFRN